MRSKLSPSLSHLLTRLVGEPSAAVMIIQDGLRVCGAS